MPTQRGGGGKGGIRSQTVVKPARSGFFCYDFPGIGESHTKEKSVDQSETQTRAPMVVDVNGLDPARCPCGWARRAFADVPGAPASVHRVEIETDVRVHYHRAHTEIYYVLECAEGAAVELDGEPLPVKPGSAVLIPPGTRHRAVGRMTILNLVVPPFDPSDEWFD